MHRPSNYGALISLLLAQATRTPRYHEYVRRETNDDASFMVEVTDDGLGFPERFDPSSDGGLGFQLMRALANGLDAQLSFEHDRGLGTAGTEQTTPLGGRDAIHQNKTAGSRSKSTVNLCVI